MSLLPVPKKITVLVDSREKKEILFPKSIGWRKDQSRRTHEIVVETRKIALLAGDYCLEFPQGVIWDRQCCFEKKGSARELFNNFFTTDKARCTRAFLKMLKIRPEGEPKGARYFLIEPSLWEIAAYEKKLGLDRGLIMDQIAQTAELFGLSLWMAPGFQSADRRYMLGEMMIRVMLAHVFQNRLKHPPYTEEELERSRKT